MKKFLLGAAAALAIAVPGVASAQSGNIDLSYTSNESSGSDLEGWGIGGQVAAGGHFQFDGRYTSLEPEFGGDIDAWSLGGHLFSRGTNWLWGGYVGFSSLEATADLDDWTLALETQYYMSRTTFTGVLSYSDADDADLNSWFIDGQLKTFPSDNFSLYAGIGFGQLDSLGNDLDAWNGSLGAEWQFASAPVSLFAEYYHGDFDVQESDGLSVGIRYNWGGSLFDQNRSGAGLARVQGVVERVLGGYGAVN